MNGILQILLPVKPKFNHLNTLCFLVFFLWQTIAFALPEFTLTVSKTDESCLGNGTLSFSVEGTDPAATVEYKIYQLPDLANPIAVQASNFLGGRTSGTYQIVATQLLNGESNSQTQQITIDNIIAPLTYSVTSTHALCGPDASITANITSGIGAQYEIISGPVTRPLQTSNTFNGIPAGLYEIRVFDNCGVGWVQAHTVISDAMQINISPGVPAIELPTCNTVTVTNTLSPSSGDSLTYPMAAEVTVFPPLGGAPIVINKSIDSGDAASCNVNTVIPLYYDQPYNYTINITDHCGNVYTRNDNLVNIKLEAVLSPKPAKCGDRYLMVGAAYYKPPITVEWLSTPAGFDPVAFNADHPGPFNAVPIAYGSFDQPVPWGTYKVRIQDACGRSAETEITIQYVPITPLADVTPHPPCNSDISDVKVSVPGFDIILAIITAGPSTYPNPIPDDVTDQLAMDDGNIKAILPNLPAGDYTIHLVDECNKVYDLPFTVPGQATTVSTSTRTDCEPGKGTIRVRGSSTNIINAVMTAAPPAYTAPLPYDVTSYISGTGVLSMAGLPAGNYSFDVKDSCGLSHNVTANVIAYEVTTNTFQLTPHCGSFDFLLNYVSTASSQSFWLQKYDPVTNTWGHPLTGAAYAEGAVPSSADSYAINVNSINLNLIFTGQFRIIKRFQSFADGSDGEYKECIEVVKEFEYTGQFEITGFEKVTCNGAFADIKVLTNGVPPLTYKITHKNGIPFFIDNGNNNVFTNLEQAIYTFEVQHACGHVATGDADVAQLPSLANAHQPGDLEACDDSTNNGQETFILSSQNNAILGNQVPANYSLTYHANLADATTGANPLPDNFTSGNAIIYARLKYIGSATDCFDIVSFNLVVHPYPVPDMAQTWPMCEGHTTTITAPAGFDHYSWSTGEQTRSITVSQSGQYILTVTSGNCSGDFLVDVTLSTAPTIQHIDIRDWTAEDNSITVILDGSNVGNYEFSIDGEHYQSSNMFNNLPAGDYTVYVKDHNECGLAEEHVFLLMYPKFFTPNGDGINDYWEVKFSDREPHLMTYIFDRYGKLITGFLPNSPGWDGKLNGEPLPSTDYWFLVIRENGKEFRGHFSMKR